MTDEPTQQSDPERLERIVDHFTRKLRAGEHPAIADYQAKFPELKEEIEDLLASVAMIEQLKSNPTHPPSNRQSLDTVSSLTQIGEYQVVREIGRGGMGIVFEAIHQSLGRRVAIKVMPTQLVNRDKYIERFKQEAQSAARLHHTNIVGVFGVGEGDGFHYYVMDFVDGQTLSEVVFGLNHNGRSQPITRVNDETRLADTAVKGSTDIGGPSHLQPERASSARTSPLTTKRGHDSKTSIPIGNPKHFRWAARMGANIADALAYAHDANILHRDIKPSNIILDRKGVVWITDFGLAKDSSSEINLTKTGDVIGTPQYLAPESLEGKYDQRSEVYCLGLTLYELATLRPAYNSGTTAEVIGAIASSSPVSPRKLNPRIPIDLSTIIDKSVARNPSERYQSADEMRKDLLAFVEDRPIAARPPSTLENVIKWSRRNPLTAALSATSALLLVLVAVSATIGYLYTMDALGKEANKSAKLLDQQKETELQRLAAVAERKEMQVQYDRAEGNIAITLEAFDQMFKQVVSRGSSAGGDISLDGFEELTGIETSITREDAAFLDKLLVFYDKFAKQNVDNDSLRMESARAFRRVANIYQLIGDSKKSIDAYNSSIQTFEKALELSPDSKEILIALVNTKCEVSSLHRRNQQWREAIGQNESAIALLQDVPVDQLDNELKLELAKTLNSLGSSSALIAAFEQARPNWFEEMARMGGRSLRRGPDGRRPDERGSPKDRAPGNRIDRGPGGRGGPPQDGRESNWHRPPGMGSPPRLVGRLSSHYSRKAIEILDDLVLEDPENTEYLFVRANCYCSLAAEMLKPEPARARNLRDKAIKELELLIENDPENHEYQFRLALACSLSDTSNRSASESELLEKSVTIAEELASKFPQFLDYHYLLVSARVRFASQLMEAKKYDEALDTLRRAMPAVQQAVSLSGSNRTQKSSIVAMANQLAKLSKETESNGMTGLSNDAKLLLIQLRNQSRPFGSR